MTVFDSQETALVFVKEGDFEQLTQLLSPVEFSRLKPLVLLLGWPYCYSCENARNLLEALWNPSVSFNYYYFLSFSRSVLSQRRTKLKIPVSCYSVL